MTTRIAIVGAGLIGSAWAVVFARSGCSVKMYDAQPSQLEVARREVARMLDEASASGLLAEAPAVVQARIVPAATLAEAVEGVRHVQENVAEKVDVKQRVFAELDGCAPADAVLASSTSGIPASAFTEAIAGRARCVVAHPINPPHLVPLVEIAGAPWTSADTVARTRDLMHAVGQSPIVVREEIEGFIVNRLQGALLREAFDLYRRGVASLADIDAALRDGLSQRWSFMGAFETIDLNAPGGIADYCQRYGPLIARIAPTEPPQPWSDELVARIEAERRTALPASGLEQRKKWRDARLARVGAFRKELARD